MIHRISTGHPSVNETCLEPYNPDYPFELSQSSGGSCCSGACNIPDLQL